MNAVYYIIPTNVVGGAEKRFIELWAYLQQKNSFNLNLIISKDLVAGPNANDTLQNIITKYKSKVFYFDINPSAGVFNFQKKLYRLVCSITKADDILHFIIGFPSLIVPLKHKKTIYTLTESGFNNVNTKGRIAYLLNILRASHVDILDPMLHKKLSHLFFYKQKRIHLTPGSFVNHQLFTPAKEKENWFVFLGRFFAMKQVLELLAAVPVICNKINEQQAVPAYKFIFIGFGHLETEMRNMLQNESFKNLPVEILSTQNPEQILNRSKIFFSLQLNNNYPSKSLLEAMAAGNIPLVTDVGTTRMLAHPDFSYYVPENFSADELATRVIEILKLENRNFEQKILAARNFVINNFSIETSAVYFSDLYNKL